MDYAGVHHGFESHVNLPQAMLYYEDLVKALDAYVEDNSMIKD